MGKVGLDAYTSPETGSVIPVRDLLVSFRFNSGEALLSNTLALSADRTLMLGSDAVSHNVHLRQLVRVLFPFSDHFGLGTHSNCFIIKIMEPISIIPFLSG